MSEKVWPLAQLFVADPDPELVEILRLEPAGLDTEEVDLFLESNSNLLSLFHSSSLSFSFFFSLFKWKNKNKTKQKFRTSLIVKVGWVTIFSEFIRWIYQILYFIFYISNVFFKPSWKKNSQDKNSITHYYLNPLHSISTSYSVWTNSHALKLKFLHASFKLESRITNQLLITALFHFFFITKNNRKNNQKLDPIVQRFPLAGVHHLMGSCQRKTHKPL